MTEDINIISDWVFFIFWCSETHLMYKIRGKAVQVTLNWNVKIHSLLHLQNKFWLLINASLLQKTNMIFSLPAIYIQNHICTQQFQFCSAHVTWRKQIRLSLHSSILFRPFHPLCILFSFFAWPLKIPSMLAWNEGILYDQTVMMCFAASQGSNIIL